jgi:hypothetical protein
MAQKALHNRSEKSRLNRTMLPQRDQGNHGKQGLGRRGKAFPIGLEPITFGFGGAAPARSKQRKYPVFSES